MIHFEHKMSKNAIWIQMMVVKGIIPIYILWRSIEPSPFTIFQLANYNEQMKYMDTINNLSHIILYYWYNSFSLERLKWHFSRFFEHLIILRHITKQPHHCVINKCNKTISFKIILFWGQWTPALLKVVQLRTLLVKKFLECFIQIFKYNSGKSNNKLKVCFFMERNVFEIFIYIWIYLGFLFLYGWT